MASIGLFLINSFMLAVLVTGSLVLQSVSGTDVASASNPATQNAYSTQTQSSASAPASPQSTVTAPAAVPSIPSVQRPREREDDEYYDD